MRIRVFDGSCTIGGNKIYVEFDGEGYFLDFGMNFAKAGEYLSDFLTERSIRGIHDYLHLGLVPELDIYRSDLIPSDVDPSLFDKLPVKAVLVSHAHADHMAHVGLLSESIPLIASAGTVAIAKANRDTGSIYIGAEATYFSPRVPDEDSRVLVSDSGALWRKIYVDSHHELEFMKVSPYSRKAFPKPDISSLDSFPSRSVEIELLPVDHSIYGASGIVLKGDTTVVYTGDMRFHGKNGKKSEEFLRKVKGKVSVLIIEGTRITRESGENCTEEEVKSNLERIFKEAEGYLFLDFSPRNLERMEAAAEAARKAGRKLAISKKMAYLVYAMRSAGYDIDMSNIAVFSPLSPSRWRRQWERNVQNWYGDRIVGVDDIRKDPDGYVLVLSYYDIKHLLDIKPEGGTYVYSSSEAFGEEQEFDFLRLNNWLRLFNIKVVGFHMHYDRVLGRARPIFESGIHSSGHLTREEIIRVVDYLDPDIVIPVHTQKPEWFLREFENARVLREGEWFGI